MPKRPPGERQIGQIVFAEDLDESDQNGAQKRPGETPHAADDHNHESVNDHLRGHADRGGDKRRGQHATYPGKAAADTEHGGADEPNVGAEGMHHLGILGGGAN